MRYLIFILLVVNVIILSGCISEEDLEDPCPEYYVKDYEYITLEDGSVITGKPIYDCRF